MRSIPEFLVVAIVVTVTPGPATAAIVRTAARDGRAAAQGTVVGNSIGVLVWGGLSAVGVSALILASEIAYDVLRVAGAAVLVMLGVRSLLARRRDGEPIDVTPRARRRAGWRSTLAGGRIGLITSVCNPKLAVFFVALFPQFLEPGTAVLPAALAMALVIVTLDAFWYSTLIYAVHRIRVLLRPRVHQWMERMTGGVLVALGVRLAADT
jgi:threonine/homoserine/homoserine lactone efflux protein